MSIYLVTGKIQFLLLVNASREKPPGWQSWSIGGSVIGCIYTTPAMFLGQIHWPFLSAPAHMHQIQKVKLLQEQPASYHSISHDPCLLQAWKSPVERLHCPISEQAGTGHAQMWPLPKMLGMRYCQSHILQAMKQFPMQSHAHLWQNLRYVPNCVDTFRLSPIGKW